MSTVVEADHCLYALLHDAAEAYIGDIISPVKQLAPNLKVIEKSISAAVDEAFGLVWTIGNADAIKKADLRMLITERNQLMGDPPEPWFCEDVVPYDFKLSCWEPSEAKWRFLDLFRQFTADGDGRWFLLMFGPKPGHWWMRSESDPRWNIGGRGRILVSSGLRGGSQECEDKYAELVKQCGEPPEDLEFGCMKD